MTVLKQYKSEEFGGLEIVIDDDTGEVFASQRAIARLIDKHNEYVRRYANTYFEGDTNSSVLTAEVLTAGGLQRDTLYDETFILSIIAKYKPDLLLKLAQTGLRLFFHKLAGYSDEQAVTASLSIWRSVRHELSKAHAGFQASCRLKGHSPKVVHDMITQSITGWTAEDARKLGQLVEGSPVIGLNHQPSPKQLEQIRRAKLLYAGFRKGDWKEQVNKAVFQATED